MKGIEGRNITLGSRFVIPLLDPLKFPNDSRIGSTNGGDQTTLWAHPTPFANSFRSSFSRLLKIGLGFCERRSAPRQARRQGKERECGCGRGSVCFLGCEGNH